MTLTTMVEPQAKNNHDASLMDDVQRATDMLRQVAATLHAREQALQAREQALQAREKEMAELLALKKIAYRFMAEDAIRALPPLPEDVDLKKWAKEQGGQPLADFIDDL